MLKGGDVADVGGECGALGVILVVISVHRDAAVSADAGLGAKKRG